MRNIDLGPATGEKLSVSQLGFGGMALTWVYGDIEPDAALATLSAAVDAGVTFLDTADVYGQPRDGETGPAGTNEELFAKLLATRRDEVQLATKFGISGQIGTGEAGTRGDAEYVRSACDASLRRLGVDVIDLYYLHRRDLGMPIEETVGAMAELVAAGKVRYLGLSEVTAEEIRAASGVHPITAVQSEWSIWSRDVEVSVVPACAELGIGFVPYSPLGRGFLAGSVDAERVGRTALAFHERFADDALAANQQIVEAVRAVAERYGATAAQVALAWLYAQGARFGLPVVPIPGTRSADRVRENAASVNLELTADDVAELDAAGDQVVGRRRFSFDPDRWVSVDRE